MKNCKSILVIDLEATCWEDKKEHTRQENEIIEIGLVEIGTKILTVTREESIIVKPTTSTISEFCTNLTTLTPEFVDLNGISFKEACEILRDKYESKSKTWFSYGAYDRHQFTKQCQKENIENPMSDAHINIKNLLALLIDEREMGMTKALDYLHIDLKGTHHRGIDDAKNIAEILIHIFKTSRHYIMKKKITEEHFS